MGVTVSDVGIAGTLLAAIGFIYQKQQTQLEGMNTKCTEQREADAKVIQGLNDSIKRLTDSVGYLRGYLAGMGKTPVELEAPHDTP